MRRWVGLPVLGHVPRRHVPWREVKHLPEYVLKHVPKHVLRHMPDKPVSRHVLKLLAHTVLMT